MATKRQISAQLLLAFAVIAAVWAHPVTAEEQAAVAAPKTRRVLYNLDGDSCMWTKKGGTQPVLVTAADMKTLIDEIAYPGSQVDTFLLNVSAQATYYPTKVGTRRGTLSSAADKEKWLGWERQRFESVEAMFAQGVDPFALLLADARGRGLEVLLTHRMNDIHDIEPLRCKFWLDHPEYRLPDHKPGSTYYQPGVHAGFDFAHAAVRDYTFSLIEEAVQRYDCDGIELDFVRAPIYFQTGSEAERIARMNELVQRVRKMLDAQGQKHGRRMVLSARVLPTEQECREIGLDPVAWATQGWIDFLTVSPYSGTRYDLPVKAWKDRITGVPIYACADSAGSAANYRQAADQFWKDGADGVYLFNFFTPREVFVEPPFDVLAQLGNRPGPAPLRVGSAAVNLAADDKMAMGGMMNAVYPKGQEGELRAVATVIEQPGSGKFAIVACDVLFVTRDMIDRAAEQIHKSCGIEPAHLLVNATHTHYAPSTVRIHGTGPEPEFVRTLEAGIVQAVEQAGAHLTDNSRFLFHLGQEPNVGSNSRMLLSDGMISWGNSPDPAAKPTGPYDPELPVWVFRSPADKLLSVIYNHSTHTVGVLRPGVRSPAFYGLAAQEVEQQLGAPVCFLEGASGSTHNGGRKVADLIADIKRDVLEGIGQATPRTVSRIAAIKRPFPYKVRTFDEPTEDKKVTDYMTAHAPGAFDFVTGVFREARAAVKPHQGEERESSIQVILIGDVALVGVPAEFFTLLGMEIKRRSPFPDTYVAELANDWIGYTPDRDAFRLGGYQTWVGSHDWAEIGTGERIVDQAVAMLEELAAQPATTSKP